MANKILMPKLSPTMEEGQISGWIKKEGDAIEANETIAEVDTDKATMEMTSLEAGTLLKILVPPGENAKLGQTIGIIGEKGEDFSSLLREVENEGSSIETLVPHKEKPETVETKPVEFMQSKTERSANGRIIVSPIAARMATENGIDVRSVTGTGPNGRIIKRDIEAAMQSVQLTEGVPSIFTQFTDIQGASAFREEKTSPMRRAIAQRLSESIGPIPTFYLTVEVEMDNTLTTRNQINEKIAPEKISVNDIIVKATAMALIQNPFVNASYQADNIRFYEDADIGVAVAIDEGLITPVVRSANKKGFVQISSEIKKLAERARGKELQPAEYTGATFSVSNLGMFGIKEFTAIINPPEASILAIGRANPIPVVRDGQITIRNIMSVTMSCDHRVVDGATGAKFLQTFKNMLENPSMMLV